MNKIGLNSVSMLIHGKIIIVQDGILGSIPVFQSHAAIQNNDAAYNVPVFLHFLIDNLNIRRVFQVILMRFFSTHKQSLFSIIA